VRALRELTWVELKPFAREPLAVVFVLVLPMVILFVLNGVFGESPPDPGVWEGVPALSYYPSAYVALVAATVGVMSLPVHLAGYREQGVLRRFRTSMSPATLVGAHTLVAAATAGLGATLLVVSAVVGYEAPLPADWPMLLAAFLLVTLAFSALGTLLGLLLPTARTAQGLGILAFFVFMMLGGAGPPREVLPGTLRALGNALPVTPAGSLLRGPWLGRDLDLGAAGVMAGMWLLCSLLAMVLLRRDSAR
jgi:ABC-2 type transport system permease protein